MDSQKPNTSPGTTGSKSPRKTGGKSSFSSITSSSSLESKKEKHHRKKRSSKELSLDDSDFHEAKKMKPFCVDTETVTLGESDGLKIKLICSPEKKQGMTSEEESFQNRPSQGTLKKFSKKSARDEQGSLILGHEPQSFLKRARKKHKAARHQHLSPNPQGFSSDTYSATYELSNPKPNPEAGSSSQALLKAEELVIDDSRKQSKKNKKKQKKKKKKKKISKKFKKKKKAKEKHRERRHSKSKKSPGLCTASTAKEEDTSASPGPPLPKGPPFPETSSSLPLPGFHPDEQSKKKKEKKEKKKRGDIEKPKKRHVTVYQAFCKEFRATILAEHPGLDFGELSKKLAEAWKQLPEEDKLSWKQQAQDLQKKQKKAKATTLKRKATTDPEGTVRAKAASPYGVMSPDKESPPSIVELSSSPPKGPDTEPINVAAHLKLLGELLTLIGHRLHETEGTVAVSGSLSVLLDSIICALGPLMCLTNQLPELNGCSDEVLSNTLDNIAYIMPGL